MRSLRATGDRLVLVVPDEAPLRAAARAIRGGRNQGVADEHAVFDYPPEPDVARALVDTFAIDPPFDPPVRDLLEQAALLEAAIATKGEGELPAHTDLATRPYLHQEAAIAFAWARWQAGARGTGLLMEQGTGKSLVAIALANALAGHGLIDWALVIAPNSLRGTWGASDGEIARHSATSEAVSCLDGSRARRAEQLARLLAEPTYLRWVVTNYEQFAVDADRDKAFRRIEAVVAERGARGLLILDESTLVKNIRAKRTRAIARLARHFPYRLILTGTPITRSPLDAFAQFEILEPGGLGFNSYLAFERAYATYAPQRIAGGRIIQVPAGYQNLPDLERRLAGMSYRVRAADCLDLPPVIVRRVNVPLSPAQARMYKGLRDEMMAEADEGALVDGRNILTRYGKLAQVAGGAVRTMTEDGRPGPLHEFDPNPKLDALREQLEILFEDPDAKAVVFAQFIPEVEAILMMCRGKGWAPAAFYGDVSLVDREEGRQRFARDPGCRVLVAQYQCGSKGLNLTAANTVVFYSLTFSLEDYLQAQKRVHRSGQTAEHVNEIYLLAQLPTRRGPRPTIDHIVLQALRDKKDLADVVTGDRARQAMEAL